MAFELCSLYGRTSDAMALTCRAVLLVQSKTLKSLICHSGASPTALEQNAAATATLNTSWMPVNNTSTALLSRTTGLCQCEQGMLADYAMMAETYFGHPASPLHDTGSPSPTADTSPHGMSAAAKPAPVPSDINAVVKKTHGVPSGMQYATSMTCAEPSGTMALHESRKWRTASPSSADSALAQAAVDATDATATARPLTARQLLVSQDAHMQAALQKHAASDLAINQTKQSQALSRLP